MRYYVTTPIYYVNAKPHLGHAYTTIVNDALTRFHRLISYESRLLTGTDEHGDKIVQAASKMGQSPQGYADFISGQFRDTWPKLDVYYNDFIRTTEERHKKAVTLFLDKVNQKGDIYFGDYGGYYCFGCERFYTEKELLEGNICPDHKVKLQYIAEENYFFKMANYQDWLIDHIRSNPDFIRPEQYRNEILSFLKDPLGDLCISRPKSRLTWGIDLPFDDKFVTYVWFDALISYISSLGWPDGENFNKFWPVANHTIAKDILKPHALFWPIMLKSAGLPIYKHLNVHGYWQIGASKMSKSIGNVVEALSMADLYGVDAFRYFLLRDMVFGLDSEFSKDNLLLRYNADLANDLGNLWQRSIGMLEKFSLSAIPPASQKKDEAWENLIAKVIENYQGNFKEVAIHKALSAVWELVSHLNKYIDVMAPWKMVKDPEMAKNLPGLFRKLLEGLALIAALLWPVMPRKAEEIWTRLGLDPAEITFDMSLIRSWLLVGRKIIPGQPLFPRIELENKAAISSTAKVDKKNINESSQKIVEENIAFDEFKKVDLKIAKILKAEVVPKSEKLLKLSVSLGQEERTIVSGIAKYFSPDDLIDRDVLVVANLKPVKIMGILSQGMLLSVEAEDGSLSLLSPDKKVLAGIKAS